MPLLKKAPKIWEALKLKEGIHARLPKHYLKSLSRKSPPCPLETPGTVHSSEETWKPQVFKRELYSEILNHKFTIPVTGRTLDLIDANYGFDYYILKTPKEDLNSKLGWTSRGQCCFDWHAKTQSYTPMTLSRERRSTTNTRSQFEIPEEEAEWVGLSLEEAVEKQRQLEHKVSTFLENCRNLISEPEPLFQVFVDKLEKELRLQKLSEPHIIEKK
ncbi:hypothetical protein INR49_022145 [Caranx melampygus]|nr:hypothetical protein INR49_022145 [Caranx melampygus]